jgi:hypothetical protein
MQDSFVLEFTFSIPEINKSLKPAAIEIVLIGTRESLLKRNRKRIELAKSSRISTHNAEVLGGSAVTDILFGLFYLVAIVVVVLHFTGWLEDHNM